jgi:hypothetical protein
MFKDIHDSIVYTSEKHTSHQNFCREKVVKKSRYKMEVRDGTELCYFKPCCFHYKKNATTYIVKRPNFRLKGPTDSAFPHFPHIHCQQEHLFL